MQLLSGENKQRSRKIVTYYDLQNVYFDFKNKLILNKNIFLFIESVSCIVIMKLAQRENSTII